MNWFHLNLCLIVAVLLTPYFVAAEDDHNLNLNVKDELVLSEQTIDNNDEANVEQKIQPGRNQIPNTAPNSGVQLVRGLIPAPLVGNPFDAQAASNKVMLVLNNDKNNFADFAKPAEDSLKRFTRNPDAMDDIVGQFQQLGGGVTAQLLQQIMQTAPEISRSFGEALNEALSQTNLLAQTAPGNIDFNQLAQTLSQSNLPGNIDFGQLGQSMSQSFLVGAAQNLLNPAGAQAADDTAAKDAEAEPDSVERAAAEPKSKPEATAEGEARSALELPKTPFDKIVGSALLPQFPKLSHLCLPSQFRFGLLKPLTGLNPFMPLGSEISEVRVMPDRYSPYKILPKPVDHQTLAEMKLKAVLRDALIKKTIPILWFHLPANHNLHKTTEDLEIEAKLEIFEKQVIAELKQLQELSKLANDVKRAQLQSGAQPTASLTTELNLYEVPIYEISLGDIEKTLKDEHVIMLMQTIVQNQNKEFHRHHQATTKYLTDLTGTPIKRQTKTVEDALKTMDKDDLLKMMTYAYRMAAINGHAMPWLKNEKITDLDEQETSNTTMSSQQQSADVNMPMTHESQWLEEKQRKMAEERKQKAHHNQFMQWVEPNMQQLPQQQPIERQWVNPNMRQQQMPIQRQMLPPQMQQQMPIQKQMIPPRMKQTVPIQNQMFDPNMQWQPQNIQRQMMPQPMMFNFDMPPQMPMQRQWGLNPANVQQQQPMMQMQFADLNKRPMQRQFTDSNMSETKGAIKTEQQPEQIQAADTKMPEQQTEQIQAADTKMPEQQTEQKKWSEPKSSDPNGDLKKTDQLAEQKHSIDTKTTAQTAAKIDSNMPPKNETLDNMPIVSEAKPQMAENAGKARHKGMEDLFEGLDVFGLGKHRGKEAAKPTPTIINYYYNGGVSRYPPVYAPADSYQSAPPAAPQGYGPPSPAPQAPSYGPPAASQGYVPPLPAPTAQKYGTPAAPQGYRPPAPAQSYGTPAAPQGYRPPAPAPQGYRPPAPAPTAQSYGPPAAPQGYRPPPPAPNAQSYGPPAAPKGYGSPPPLPTALTLPEGYEPPTPPPPPIIYGKPIDFVLPPSALAALNHGRPAAPQGYGSPPPAPAAQSYGPAGGAAYGSFGGYRSATGDEEIAVMLQQHQLLPKMMMLHNEPTITTSTTTTTATENYINNAEHPNKNHTKRLAKNKHTEIKQNPGPAAYMVIIKNNTYENKSGSRSRRKRSTEYATLEPIDENSLDALRKTYKNSLKEITLNPNETPAEALRRYNAESIREALQKAHQQPMDVSAGGEHEEVKEGQLTNEVPQQYQSQHVPQQQLTQDYASSNSDQYMPVTTVPQSQLANGAYITLPVPIQQTSVAYNQQQSPYNPSPSQAGFYNNVIRKYNTPVVYSSNNQMMSQNPFLSMYNSLESLPYIDDYSVANQQYRDANHNIINSVGKAPKSIVYQKLYTQPQFSYNHLNIPAIKSPNTINKNVHHMYTTDQHIKDNGKAETDQYGNYASELPTAKTYYTFSNSIQKHDYISSYSPLRQSQIELPNHYEPITGQESLSFESLMAVIKERLAKCCNECKDNILKGLDKTLKQKHYGNDDKMKFLEINEKPYATIMDNSHILSYPNTSREEDSEYKQWLNEMSEKGYDKNYLTKQQQREYLTDGKLHLYVTDDRGHSPEEEKIFFANNQSYKRETNVPKPDVEVETKADIVTDPIVVENNIKKIEQQDDEEKKVEEHEANAEAEEVKEMEFDTEQEKETPIVIKVEKAKKQIEKETETKQDKDKNETKVTVKKEKPQNLNTTKAMGTAESTTHSVYALRGTFRSQNRNPAPFQLKQGKQFDNYKNINKLGRTANSLTKSHDKTNSIDKNYKLEEILDILHDLSKHTEEKIKETSKEDNSKAHPTIDNSSEAASTTTLSTTSITDKSLTTLTAKTADSIFNEQKTKDNNSLENSKKLSRRRARLLA